VVGARPGTVSRAAKTPASPAEQAWTLIRQFVDEHSRHGDLTDALGFSLGAGRGKVLFQLRNGPLTHRRLAELNETTGPYVSVIVDKLEEHGLVARGPHPDDGRRKLVSLTPTGLDAIATAEAILYRPPEAMTALSEKELKELIGLVKRVLDADDAGPLPHGSVKTGLLPGETTA
jgi:DNA-binding MarR family transcriptional regulator